MRLPAAERRRQLLDVALEVFARRGFHATSMNELADAAGVTKPVLYQHFPSKRELYLLLLDDVRERLVDAVATAVASRTEARDKLEAGLRAYFSFVAEERTAFSLLFGGGAPREDDVVHAVREAEVRIAEAIAELLDDVPADRRRQVAFGILGLAQGTVRHWTTSHQREDPGELARRTAELLWGGLREVATG